MDNSEQLLTRSVFRRLLTMLADLEAQRAYERDVPIANVPGELVWTWFDDNYYPESEWFIEAFDAEERNAMADFTSLFHARLDALSPATHEGTVSLLHATPEWLEIVAEAKQTLGRVDHFDLT